MKPSKLVVALVAASLGLISFGQVRAGEKYSSRSSAKAPVQSASHCARKSKAKGSGCQRQCDRRCARLMRLVRSRGCVCPDVAQAIHPRRSHTYLSSHYPPFRYSD